MKAPDFLSTIMRLSIWVAVVLVAIMLSKFARDVLTRILDDDHVYLSQTWETHDWESGPSPRVEVDLFEGTIYVVQGEHDRVTASLNPFLTTKTSQASADATLKALQISATREGDQIRIKTSKIPTAATYFQLRANLTLSVPPGASLDLVTGHGYIYLGKSPGGPSGAMPTGSPLILKAVKARDLGEIYSGIEAEIADRPSGDVAKLDLESRLGTVVIRGRDLLVDARTDRRAAIDFRGSLAPGVHHFDTGGPGPDPVAKWERERGVRIGLPDGAAFEVDATTVAGSISVDFPHTSFLPANGQRVKARVGENGETKLEIRTFDRPIEIYKAESPAAIGRSVSSDRPSRTGPDH